jgi:hypothetical protein
MVTDPADYPWEGHGLAQGLERIVPLLPADLPDEKPGIDMDGTACRALRRLFLDAFIFPFL